MKTHIFILLVSLAIPTIISAHGIMNPVSSTTFEMMRVIENKVLPSNELHEEMEKLMMKMITGQLTEEEANKMVEFMSKYPGPMSIMMSRMGMNNMMMNQQNFNRWMVPGGGMMGFGINSINPFINIWHWIAFLAVIIWLIVGFLAAIWLGKKIQEK